MSVRQIGSLTTYSAIFKDLKLCTSRIPKNYTSH